MEKMYYTYNELSEAYTRTLKTINAQNIMINKLITRINELEKQMENMKMLGWVNQ